MKILYLIAGIFAVGLICAAVMWCMRSYNVNHIPDAKVGLGYAEPGVTGEWHWEKFTDEEIKNMSGFKVEVPMMIKRMKEAGIKRVLDVGAAPGQYSIYMAQEGLEVHALDLNKFGMARLAQMAAENGLNVKTVVADAREIPYPDNYFDGVVATQVVNLSGCNNINRILSEICRVTRPEGHVYVTINYFTEDSWKTNDTTKEKHNQDEKTRIDTSYCAMTSIDDFKAYVKPFINPINMFYINPYYGPAQEYEHGYYFVRGTCKK